MKALAGSSWAFLTKTLVIQDIRGHRTFHPKLHSPIWFSQVSSFHLDKLEVIQNKDCNRLPPKRRGVPPHSRGWSLSPEGATGTMLKTVLIYASALQPTQLTHRPLSTQGNTPLAPCIVPQNPEKPASQR